MQRVIQFLLGGVVRQDSEQQLPRGKQVASGKGGQGAVEQGREASRQDPWREVQAALDELAQLRRVQGARSYKQIEREHGPLVAELAHQAEELLADQLAQRVGPPGARRQEELMPYWRVRALRLVHVLHLLDGRIDRSSSL